MSDPETVLRRLAEAMEWTLETDRGWTLVLPDGVTKSIHTTALDALAFLAYAVRWRKDAEEIRTRVGWTGPASDEMEGIRGDALRWLSGAG